MKYKRNIDKQLLIFFLVLIGTNAFSQTEKGNFIVGGEVFGDYYNHKYDDPDTKKYNGFNVGFRPQLGMFVLKNLALRMTPQFTLSEQTIIDRDRLIDYQFTTSSGYGLMIGATKYFGQQSIKPFTGIAAGFSNIKTKRPVLQNVFENGDVTYKRMEFKEKNVEFNIAGGISYFVNQKVGIDLFLEYSLLRNMFESVFVENGRIDKHNIYFGTGITVIL